MRFVAGRGAAAKLQTSLGAAAKSHREVVAGLGAAAKSHREDAADRRCGRAADRLGRSGKVAGRGAVAKRQAGNALNAKEPAPADGTGPSQTFGCIQAEQSLVEDFVCLFLLRMRIYI